MATKQTLEISTFSILKVIGIVLGLVFLYFVRETLLMLFISLIIAAAADGPVDWLAKHKVRRIFGTTIVYVLLILFLILFIYLVFPPLAGQIKLLAKSLPEYLNKLGADFDVINQKVGIINFQGILENLSSRLSGAASNIFGTAVNVFGGIINGLIVIVISVYLVAQDKAIKNFIYELAPIENRAYIARLVEKIQLKLGRWMRGQLILMLIIGVLTYVGLALLKVKFALTLGLIAGLLEIVPYIGPILSATPAILIALTQSPLLALLVLALFVLIQQSENYLIMPQIMKRAIGLNPLIIIIALIMGGQLAGIIGIVVAVPTAAVISVFLNDIFKRGEQT